MRSIAAFFILVASATAQVIAPDGRWLNAWPATHAGMVNHSRDYLEAAGFRAATTAEIDARQAAADAAAAEAALHTYPQPETLIPVVDLDTWESTGRKRHIIDAATGEPLYITDTASPQKPAPVQKAEAVAQRDARLAAKTSLREAKNFNDFHEAFLLWIDGDTQ